MNIAKQDRSWSIGTVAGILENMFSGGVLETARIAVSEVPQAETMTVAEALNEAWSDPEKPAKIQGKTKQDWIALLEAKQGKPSKLSVIAGRHTAIAAAMASIATGKEHTVKTVTVAPDKWRKYSLRENVAKMINNRLTGSDSVKAVSSLMADGLIEIEAEVQGLGYRRGTAQKLFRLAKLVKLGAPVENVIGLDIKKADDVLKHVEEGMPIEEAIALVPERKQTTKPMSKANMETLAKECSNPMVKALIEALITDSGIGARKAIASL